MPSFGKNRKAASLQHDKKNYGTTVRFRKKKSIFATIKENHLWLLIKNVFL